MPVRQRLEVEGREEGRPRVRVHADGARGGGCDAWVRAHRCGALGGVRGILARCAARPHSRFGLPGGGDGRRGSARRAHRAAEGEHARGAGGVPGHPHVHRGASHGQRGAVARGTRRVVPRGDGGCLAGVSGRGARCGGCAVHSLHFGLDGHAEGGAAHPGGVPALRHAHVPVHLRLPRRRRVLVHGRCGVDHGAYVRDLRAAVERCDDGAVRGGTELSGPQPVLADLRPVRGEHLLHCADGDSRADGSGRRVRDAHEPGEHPCAGDGWRADQSGGVGVVLPRGGGWTVSDRRHVVADRDGRCDDHAAAGVHAVEAGFGDASAVRGRAGAGGPRGGRARGRGGRCAVHQAKLAGPDAHGVRGPRAVRADVLFGVSGTVHDRRRGATRRGRVLLDHGSGGRCSERVGAPDGDGGGGECAGAARDGVGGGGGGVSARDQGPGDLRVRDAQCGGRGERGVEEGAGGTGAQGDRPDRLAGPDSVCAGVAEDAFGEDHAADPAQGGGERDGESGRHLDAGRAGGGGRHHREPPQSVARLLNRPRPWRHPAPRMARAPRPNCPALKLERRRRCRTEGTHSGILNPRRRHVVRTIDRRIRRLREPRARCARHEERGLPNRACAQTPAREGEDRLQARLLRLGTVPQRGAGVSQPGHSDDRHSREAR